MFYLNYYMKQFIGNICEFIYRSFLCILVNDYFQRKFPVEYNNFIVKLTFESLHMYSELQLFGMKCKNKWNLWLHSKPHIKNIINHIYYIPNTESKNITEFKDGTICVKTYSKENPTHFQEANDSLYILHDCVKENSKCIISRSQVFPEDYEVSSMKFLMVELNLSDNKYKIDLVTEDENYYIVQNVLDKDFFLYYMVSHSQNYPDKIVYEDLKQFMENGIVKIIDDNAQIVEVDLGRKESIVILKDNYTINKNE